MINLTEILKEIEETGIVERTTKELKENGLNNYYIKKAIEAGALEKISHGKYKVVNAEKNINRRMAFSKFTKAIFRNDFEAAYEALCINLANQTSHDYDYNLKLYFILLRKILDDKKDFSFIDDILTFSNPSVHGTYYEYFNDFSTALLMGDFEIAYQSISIFKDKEKARRNQNCISTELLYCLSKHAFLDKKKEEKNTTNDYKKRQSVDRNNSYNYKKHYASMQKNIEEGNLKLALEDIKKAFEYALPKAQDNLQKMVAIIKKYLEISETKEPLEELEIDYSHLEDNYNEILNKALDQKDYQTAYKNIGKCLYYAKSSTSLKLYRKLLQMLIDQNKENQKLAKRNIENTRIQSKNQQVEITEPSEELDASTIAELVYNREYDKLKTLLENRGQAASRLEDNVLEMIKDMERMQLNEAYSKDREHIYRNERYRVFKRFFESLRFKDYQEAADLVDKCIEIAKSYGEDTLEFSTYRDILEDVLAVKKEALAKYIRASHLSKLANQQKSLILKNPLTSANLSKIEKITVDKISLEDEKNCSFDNRILEMLEMFQNISDYNLDANSFFQNTYSADVDIITNFYQALSLGDYQSAYQISQDKNWNKEAVKNENSDYLFIYKHLAYQINKKIETNSKPLTPGKTASSLLANPAGEELSVLKNLLKKRKFQEAYDYYQEQDSSILDDQLAIELQVFLPFLVNSSKKEEELTAENDYKNLVKTAK